MPRLATRFSALFHRILFSICSRFVLKIPLHQSVLIRRQISAEVGREVQVLDFCMVCLVLDVVTYTCPQGTFLLIPNPVVYEEVSDVSANSPTYTSTAVRAEEAGRPVASGPRLSDHAEGSTSYRTMHLHRHTRSFDFVRFALLEDGRTLVMYLGPSRSAPDFAASLPLKHTSLSFGAMASSRLKSLSSRSVMSSSMLPGRTQLW